MMIRCMNCMKEYDEKLGACPDCGFVRGTPPREIYHLHPEVSLSGRYLIGTVIAYGGFGILYRAWDTLLEVMVAVKEYFPASFVNRNPGETEIFIYTKKGREEFKQGVAGFLEEAKNTSRFCTHPNIVNVYDYFEANGTAYMVMEFMDGVSLKEYAKQQGGRIGWEKAVEIGCSMLDILKEVHAAGILHRDISPDNIMLCKNGAVKLFDFGAARFSSLEKDVTRTIILKIGFAPPEQYRLKSRQGPWTDLYALGATLYRSITGVLPEESVNRKEAVARKEGDPLKRPRELAPEIPEYLDVALLKAMALEPKLRFQNAMQLKDALLNKKHYYDIEEEVRRKKRFRKAGIAMVTVALTAGILGCVRYYKEKEAEANLTEMNLTVWISADSGQAAAQQELFENMASEFRSTYPEVHLDLECIPKEEYAARLDAAAGTEQDFPVLFDSEGLSGELAGRMADLSDLYELVDRSDYYFLDDKSLEVIGRRQLPLGFYASVIFGNTSLMENPPKEGAVNDREEFMQGKGMMWLSDTGNYQEVQSAIPGLYTVMPVPGDEFPIRLGQIWSVDEKAPEIKQTAAKRLLYYLLGESAQDVLHIQNDTALPMNKNEFRTYLDVNQEFDFLEAQLEEGESIHFLKQEESQKQYDELYQRLIMDEAAMAKLKSWQETR